MPVGPEICAPCLLTLGSTNNCTMPERLCTKLSLIPWRQFSLHICSLPHSPPRSLCRTHFYTPSSALLPISPKLVSSFQSISCLWPHLHPGELCFPPRRGMSLNFSKSWGSRSSSALSRASLEGGIAWGRSILGCSLDEGSLLEGHQPSFIVGVCSRMTC